VILLAVWAAGALLFLLPVIVGLWHMRNLCRVGQPWRHGQLIVRKLAADVGVRRPVEVLLHGAVSGPGSCGTLQPVIVLPMDAPTWHEDDLSRAIIHELEHVQRGDWVSQCLARAVCACYWFHPLVWIAWRQLVLEAERACDDAVLRHAEATAYADQLVMLAERMSHPPNWPLLTLANRTELAARVVAVLDSRQQRGPASIVCLALACVASVLLVATISPFRIVTAAQTQEQTQTFSGSLTDPLGRTLPDARLTLWNTYTQQPIETRSDRAGHFKFSGIPAGSYRLQVDEFGSQGQISLAHGQHLSRNIALVMGGMEDTLTVHSNDAPTALPPLPAPLPLPSQTSEPYPNQADLSRCAQVSMFCRVMPPVQIARIQPIYPAKQREGGIAGTVVVEGRVGTDGLIKDLHAISPADPDFASSTVDALRRWQFTPIRLDGVQVDTNIRVTAHFVVQ
jgi:TonB family protein